MPTFSLYRPLQKTTAARPAPVPPSHTTSSYVLEVLPLDSAGLPLTGATVFANSPGLSEHATLAEGQDRVVLRARGALEPTGDAQVWYLGELVGRVALADADRIKTGGAALHVVSVPTEVSRVVDETASRPSAPTGLYGDRAPGGRIVAAWSATTDPAVFYRVWTQTQHADGSPGDRIEVAHQREARVVFEDVRTNRSVTLYVQAENAMGLRSDPVTVDVDPVTVHARSSLARLRSLPVVGLTGYSNGSVNLADGYLYLGTDPALGEDPPEVDLVTLRIDGVPSEMTATYVPGPNGSLGSVRFTNGGNLSALVVLVRVKAPGLSPSWAVVVGGFHSVVGAGRTYGGIVGGPGLQGALEFWLEDAVPVVLDHTGRHAHDLAVETTIGGVRLQPVLNGMPEVAVLRTPAGLSAFVVSSEPQAQGFDLPLLPGTFALADAEFEAEQDGAWREVSVSPDFPFEQVTWDRVSLYGAGPLTSLYDVSPRHEPRALYSGPPSHYDGTWFDRALYAADAVLEAEYVPGDKRRVVFRSGWATDYSDPLVPVVTDLEAVSDGADGAGIRVRWRMRHPVTQVDFAAAAPVFVSSHGSPPVAASHGQGSARVFPLVPRTQYTVRVGSATSPTTTAVTTGPVVPAVYVTGAATTDGYAYGISVSRDAGDPWESWTLLRGFEAVVEDSLEAELVFANRTDSHIVRVTWADGHEVVVATQTRWQLPAGAIAFKAPVLVGHSLVPSNTPAIRFARRQYEGSKTETYPHNLYTEPGTYRLELVATLQPGLEGGLRDYVAWTWVGPGGELLGEVVQLDAPAELAVQIEVRAEGGRTPIVHGYMPLRTKLPAAGTT